MQEADPAELQKLLWSEVEISLKQYLKALIEALLKTELEAHLRALRYDPDNAEYWHLRGRSSHYSVERLDTPRAIEDYRHALALNPRLAEAWLDLADCYERQGQTAEAEAALEKGVALQPYSPATHWQLGNFYLRRRDLAGLYQARFRLAAGAHRYRAPPRTAAAAGRLRAAFRCREGISACRPARR